MTEELDILKIIAENPEISQRKIAEQTGMSLGQVNFLIKKCVKKGLVKIEGQTSKSIRYNLTPQGAVEKAQRTLKYIKISYLAVIALTNKIRALMKQYKENGFDIYVFGSQDEMMEIAKLALGNECAGYILCNKQEDCKGFPIQTGTQAVIFYWEDEMASGLEKYHYKLINILE